MHVASSYKKGVFGECVLECLRRKEMNYACSPYYVITSECTPQAKPNAASQGEDACGKAATTTIVQPLYTCILQTKGERYVI